MSPGLKTERFRVETFCSNNAVCCGLEYTPEWLRTFFEKIKNYPPTGFEMISKPCQGIMICRILLAFWDVLRISYLLVPKGWHDI